VTHGSACSPTAAYATTFGPGSELNAACPRAPARGVLDCAFFHGFPYADTPLAGAIVVATTDGDIHSRANAANRRAPRLGDAAEAFRPSTRRQAAVAQSLRAPRPPP